MKKFVYVMMSLLCLSLYLTAQEDGKAEKPKEEEKKEAKSSKYKEMVIEGVVTKEKKGFYLKTDMDHIKLPVSKEEPNKFNFEDFVDKKVKVTGTVHMKKDKKSTNFPDKHVLKKITSITLVEEAKPEEKK